MKITDDVVLEFTTEQQQEIIRKCGFNPEAVNTSALSLIKFSLAALAGGSDSLPLVKNISTAKLILDYQNTPSNANEIYYIVINLTQEQRTTIKSVVNKDWNQIMFFPDEHDNTFSEKWESVGSVRPVGKSIVILPEGIDYSPLPNEKVILLPCNKNESDSAFGKGNHGTTQSVIRLMEKYLAAGGATLDVGTGTGVLAVAAARFGAENIVAIDIDADAVNIAKKTVTINDLENRIKVKEGTIDSVDGVFDVVLGNLFPRIIISLAPEFSQKVVTGGFLIVSGIVEPRAAGIISVLEAVGFEYIDTVVIRNWAAVILKKCDD